MGKLDTKTAAKSILIVALTLGTPIENAMAENEFITSELQKYSCNETRNVEISYIDEQYLTTNKIPNILLTNLDDVNIIDPNVLPQKNLDADMLTILNSIDIIAGKKEPSKPRF